MKLVYPDSAGVTAITRQWLINELNEDSKARCVMRKLINAMLASLFIFAVLAAIPQYSDFIDNPGKAVTSGPQVPENMGSWE